MMGDLRVELDGRVAVITIDRPKSLNSIGLATMSELEQALDEVTAARPSVVVVTGAGERAFVAGGDLKELESVRSVDAAREMASRMRHSLDRLAALPQPVIAALNGDAYGGGAEIAVACDFRIAADDAKIGFTQVRLAIMPAWGGIERLATIVGRAKALYLLETGSVLDAPQAMTWGLVEEVVPRAGFADRWRQLAQEMAQTPREALIGIKAALDSVKVHPSAADAATATEAFAQAWAAPAHWAAADDLARRRREARNR